MCTGVHFIVIVCMPTGLFSWHPTLMSLAVSLCVCVYSSACF